MIDLSVRFLILCGGASPSTAKKVVLFRSAATSNSIAFPVSAGNSFSPLMTDMSAVGKLRVCSRVALGSVVVPRLNRTVGFRIRVDFSRGSRGALGLCVRTFAGSGSSASGVRPGSSTSSSSGPGITSGVGSVTSETMVSSLTPPISDGSMGRGDVADGIASSRIGRNAGGSGSGAATLSSGAAAVIDSNSSSGASCVMSRSWNVNNGSVEVRFLFLAAQPLIVCMTRSVIGSTT